MAGKSLCSYNLDKECTYAGSCNYCEVTENLKYAIIEYNEKWCPNGQIISRWETEERAEEIYAINELDKHETSKFEIIKLNNDLINHFENEKSLATLQRAERNYKILKIQYDVEKANLWLNTEWEAIFSKKPTQKDKDSWIDFELADLKKEVVEAEVTYNYLRRKQRVQELELKIQGE